MEWIVMIRVLLDYCSYLIIYIYIICKIFIIFIYNVDMYPYYNNLPTPVENWNYHEHELGRILVPVLVLVQAHV